MSNQIYVWDRFVRIFHWSLVLLFITSYISGEQEHWIHSYSGYAIIILVLLRFVWGFIGTKYAQFRNFVKSPTKTVSYVKSIAAGSSERYLGHNPAGGMMIITLLLFLLLTTVSGMKLYAIEEGKGPFAQEWIASSENIDNKKSYEHEESKYSKQDDYDDDDEEHEAEEFWEEIHETSINIMILLILLHVIGVVISSHHHNELLVKSMFTGYKKDDN